MNKRVLIVGAGGHGQVVADILLRQQAAGQDVRLQGFIDDEPLLERTELMGFPVFGSRQMLAHVPHEALVAAVGENSIRRQLFDELIQAGERFINAVHPSAVFGSDVFLGQGCVVMPGVIVNIGVRIGDNVILNTGCTVDHHCKLDAHVHIAPGCHLGGNVTVGEGALIGIGATVMPGRRIGSWSQIGAGALACEDVPDRQTIVGVPGRILPKDVP